MENTIKLNAEELLTEEEAIEIVRKVYDRERWLNEIGYTLMIAFIFILISLFLVMPK